MNNNSFFILEITTLIKLLKYSIYLIKYSLSNKHLISEFHSLSYFPHLEESFGAKNLSKIPKISISPFQRICWKCTEDISKLHLLLAKNVSVRCPIIKTYIIVGKSAPCHFQWKNKNRQSVFLPATSTVFSHQNSYFHLNWKKTWTVSLFIHL